MKSNKKKINRKMLVQRNFEAHWTFAPTRTCAAEKDQPEKMQRWTIIQRLLPVFLDCQIRTFDDEPSIHVFSYIWVLQLEMPRNRDLAYPEDKSTALKSLKNEFKKKHIL